MPTENVLLQVNTAANMSGFDALSRGLLGVNTNVMLLGASLGLLGAGVKSAMDISEKWQQAQNSLTQAVEANNKQLSQHAINLDDERTAVERFIYSNRGYITDQAEVVSGYAQLIRSGLTQIEVQKDMNRALDLSALKHISLSDAVTLVDNAEHGRLRGLIDLGITSAKYVDSAGNLVDANHNMAAVMAELDAKTLHGRDSMTQLQQEEHKLSNDWQDLAKNAGPGLIEMLDSLIGKVDEWYGALDRIGKDNALWATISDRLVSLAADARVLALQLGIAEDTARSGKMSQVGPPSYLPPSKTSYQSAQQEQAALNAQGQGSTPGRPTVGSSLAPAGVNTNSGYDAAAASRQASMPHYAVGGRVTTPTVALIGESGPEDIVPVGAGSAGGNHVHHHYHIGTVISSAHDRDQFVNMLLREARYRPAS